MDPAGRPFVGWGSSKGARPNEDDVGHRPQQAHDETVRIEEATDLAAARALVRIEGDNSIERRDEVRNDGRAIGMEGDLQVAAIIFAQTLGQVTSPSQPGRSGWTGIPQPFEADSFGRRDRSGSTGRRQEAPRRRPLTSKNSPRNWELST
jgi:hypothetical protein